MGEETKHESEELKYSNVPSKDQLTTLNQKNSFEQKINKKKLASAHTMEALNPSPPTGADAQTQREKKRGVQKIG